MTNQGREMAEKTFETTLLKVNAVFSGGSTGPQTLALTLLQRATYSKLMCCNIETLNVLSKPAVLCSKISLIRDQSSSVWNKKGLVQDIRFTKRHPIPLH